MATPTTRRGTRGGGTPLIALGIVLALATGILILVLNSGISPTAAASSMAVVVATRNLPPGTVFSANPNDPALHLSDLFTGQNQPDGTIPPNAIKYTSQADLARLLDGKRIVLSTIMAGDVLRANDPRIVPLGSAPANSLVNLHPAALPAGSVLYALHTDSAAGMQVGAQEGDHVDVLATLCMPGAKGNCQVTQTALQNLLVYAIPNATQLVIVVTHQEALALKLLVENGKIDLVLRKPGDTAPSGTQAIDISSIINRYGYTQP